MDEIESLSEPSPFENLLTKYKEKSGLRAIIQLALPIAQPIDNLLMEKVNQFKVRRLAVLLDELDRQGLELTEEDIANEEMLEAIYITLKATSKAIRNDKIKRFARLLTNFHKKQFVHEYEEFEELAQILDELLPREFHALVILKNFELNIVPKRDVELIDQIKAYWDQYIDELNKKCDLPKYEVPDFLRRLERTGLYKQIEGSFDVLDGVGCLTALFAKLTEVIEDPDGQANKISD